MPHSRITFGINTMPDAAARQGFSSNKTYAHCGVLSKFSQSGKIYSPIISEFVDAC